MVTKKTLKTTKWILLLLILFSSSHIFAAICGDVNNDNNVNIVDALLIAKAYVGDGNVSQYQADVNNDGKVDIKDALLIAQLYVKIIDNLPGCPEPPNVTPTPGEGVMLPQEGNPAVERFELYKRWIKGNLNDTKRQADYVLSHQYDCGGWPKNTSYNKMGKGGKGKGTIDNGATTAEIIFLAYVYKLSGVKKYLDGARKGVDYLLEMQYPKGGFPQFYPLRGGYSDHVTFNDDAMSRAIVVLDVVSRNVPPVDGDVFTSEQRARAKEAVKKGVDFILKAQIEQNGKPTVWCAQHGKDDYQPKKGRVYEHASLSGSESVEVIGFLMTLPQTPEIKQAVIAALDWFRSPNTYMIRKGKKTWFRFYDIPTNKPIFSNYDGKKWVGIEHEGKKKGGYSWSGSYGDAIIAYAEKVGY